MSSTSVKTYTIYAPNELVFGMRWTGSNAAYGLIKHWAKEAVRLDAGRLYLNTEDGEELVEVGNHLVLVNKSFHQFTEDDLKEVYIEVKE